MLGWVVARADLETAQDRAQGRSDFMSHAGGDAADRGHPLGLDSAVRVRLELLISGVELFARFSVAVSLGPGDDRP